MKEYLKTCQQIKLDSSYILLNNSQIKLLKKEKKGKPIDVFLDSILWQKRAKVFMHLTSQKYRVICGTYPGAVELIFDTNGDIVTSDNKEILSILKKNIKLESAKEKIHELMYVCHCNAIKEKKKKTDKFKAGIDSVVKKSGATKPIMSKSKTR